MKWHNSWELCHSISTTHVLALWACWLQHYLSILNCGVSKVKTEKSQESKKDSRSTIVNTNYHLPAFQEEAWFSIFMSLFAILVILASFGVTTIIAICYNKHLQTFALVILDLCTVFTALILFTQMKRGLGCNSWNRWQHRICHTGIWPFPIPHSC